jgi:hypothetical protein
MFARSLRFSGTSKVVSILFSAFALGTSVCSAANADNLTVRRLGHVDGDLASGIAKQVRLVAFSRQHDSPVLLEGATLSRLNDADRRELKATYQAGYTIVLLDANAQHIKALHAIVGAGFGFRSKESASMMAYALRRENLGPTAMVLTPMSRSPLQTADGKPDATAVADDALALGRAVDRTVTELRRQPTPIVAGPPASPDGTIEWDQNPLQTDTFAVSTSQGVYNTEINVFALHRCLDNTDHYVVTAAADWTATQAKWQGATSAGSNPSMYQDNNGNLVINWQDGRTFCSSGGAGADFDDVCRYANYPLSYGLTMVPRTEGTVIQTNAAPAATQGQQTTYTSGFSFSIGGTVNVSANGPGGGLSANATWSNTTQTTVPPLIVEVGNTGNEGAAWNFKYCTTGLEPDPGTDCTGHVQMVKDVCQAQLGDDSGTDPQLGQTANGKFSNVVQSAHWTADPDTRTQAPTFDIEVGFTASIGTTIAHLGYGLVTGPDPIAGCNQFGCACVSSTEVNPVVRSVTFEIPFPATACK